jgi:hypothetical protein
MTESDMRRIKAATDLSIVKMELARAAATQVADAIARQGAAADLKPLLDRVVATHEAAVTAIGDLDNAVTSARIESMSQRLQLAVSKVGEAKASADRL